VRGAIVCVAALAVGCGHVPPEVPINRLGYLKAIAVPAVPDACWIKLTGQDGFEEHQELSGPFCARAAAWDEVDKATKAAAKPAVGLK
jgi:hypothetical protein